MTEPEPHVVVLHFEPETRGVKVSVPVSDVADTGRLEPPDWLAQTGVADDTSMHEIRAIFEGTLPGIGDGPSLLGASGSGAFLIGSLSWAMDPTNEGPTEITLSTPAHYRGVATGDLVSETISQHGYTARFLLHRSIEPPSFFFGPYQIAETTVQLREEPVTLRTYFKETEAEYADAYLQAAVRYLREYDSAIGAYPYAGFSVVSAPIPVGLAFPGVTYVSEQILAHPYMLGRSLAHEVLHSWWGNGIRVDYETGNWAEGLTSYLADHALAAERDPEAAKAMRREWLASLSSLPPSMDRPIREFVASSHGSDQSVGYGKTAMLFHMLRLGVGEETFDAALRNFWDEHRGTTAGWSDLQVAFESESGRDLSPFFSQWLEWPGLPELRLDSVSSDAGADEHIVSLTLAQDGPAYSLEVPVVVETSAGAVSASVTLEGPSTQVDIAVKAQPVAIAVDPDFDVLRRLADGELPPTIRDVLRAESPALLFGQGASSAAESLASGLLRPSGGLASAPFDESLPGADAFVAVGTTDEVAEMRSRLMKGPEPAIARQGDARAWVEKDGEERPWLFASADNLDGLHDSLASLRYYGSQSFISVDDGSRPVSGRWPVTDSPMRLSLSRD